MLEKIKKNKTSLAIIGIYIGLIFLISLFNFLFLSEIASKYIIFILTIALSFILSFKFGKNRINKGYLSGIKVSIIIIIIFNVLNFLLIRNKYTIARLIYYLIIILVSVFASIIGINKKAS